MSQVSMTLSEKMIEDVFAEYEREHPGKDGMNMGAKEFSDRLMTKMFATTIVASPAPEREQ